MVFLLNNCYVNIYWYDNHEYLKALLISSFSQGSINMVIAHKIGEIF